MAIGAGVSTLLGVPAPTATRADQTPGPLAALWRAWFFLPACLLCLATGLWCIAAAPVLYYEDAVHYASLGAQLAAGHGYHSTVLRFPDLMQPPLYSMLIAVLCRAGLSPVAAAVVICTLSGVLTMIALTLLHGALWGRRGQGLTAAIAAIYPNLAFGAALVLEPLFICLLGFALYLAIRAAQLDSVGRAGGSGLLLGLAILVRPEVVLTAAVIVAMLLSWPARRRRRLGWLAALTGAAVLAVLPYGLWMQARLGAFEILPKIRYNLTFAKITDRMAWEPDQIGLVGREQRTMFTLMPDRRDFVMNHKFTHPEFDAARMFPQTTVPRRQNLWRLLVTALGTIGGDALWHTAAFHPLALVLLLVGGLAHDDGHDAAAGRGRRVASGALLALVGLHLIPALASGLDYTSRYLAASLLFSVPLVSAGCSAVAAWARRRVVAVGLAPVLSAAVLSWYGSGTFTVARGQSGGPEIIRRSAALLQASETYLPTGSRVLAEGCRYAFLRQGLAFQLPYVATQQELLDYIDNHHIEYAILDARTLRQNPSRVDRELLDPRRWPRSFVPLVALFEQTDPIWIVKLR